MNAHDHRFDPVAELKANVSVPFNRAKAMPKSVYASEEFAAREVSDIFARQWFSLGRASSLANPGDYVTAELAGQPIMVIRDREGGLRAQSNVCLHRMSVLLEGKGHVNSIVCPYHGWSYKLDGSLRATPAKKTFPGLDLSRHGLEPVEIEVLAGLVFVRVVGLGPTAGVLAIALTYGGMLGKVYSEILDSGEHHVTQSLLRGFGDDLPFLEWRAQSLYRLTPRLLQPRGDDPRDRGVYIGALFAFAEMALHGVSTVCDFFYLNEAGNDNARAVIQAAKDVGLRIVLARCFYDYAAAPKLPTLSYSASEYFVTPAFRPGAVPATTTTTTTAAPATTAPATTTTVPTTTPPD